MQTDWPIGRALNGMIACVLAFSSVGFQRPFASSTSCATAPVRLTLASEQVTFCSPTSLPTNTVEDDLTIPGVGYAGLNQGNGYGFLSVRAASSGSAPGPGMPVYTPGEIDSYRQAVRDAESKLPDRLISAGPSSLLWDETVPGFQIDFTLVTETDEIPLRTVEWYVEHDDRLWAVSLTWDVSMANASEWDSASKDFSIEPSAAAEPDTALDLGAAYLNSQQVPGDLHAAGIADLPLPSWWGGAICDDNPSPHHYYSETGIHSKPLPLNINGGTPWHGFYACGTNPISAMINYGVTFPGATYGVLEFQCVELVMRFLFQEWGINPWPGNASQIAYSPSLPSALIFYPNDGTHSIVPGDVITENTSSTNTTGHTILVTGVTVNGNGTGTINILEQNSSSNGYRSLNINTWTVATDSWTNLTVQGWLHAKANTSDADPDPAFSGSVPNGPVTAISPQSSGKIIIGGDFTGVDATARDHIARLNTNGSLDGSFGTLDGFAKADPGTVQINALKVQSDDKVLVGGYFDSYDDTSRFSLARLNANGSLDNTFGPGASVTKSGALASVWSLAVQGSDGKILIGGDFEKYKDTNKANLARLDSAGNLDPDFSGSTDGIVYAIALQSDGRILIGGSFTHVDSASRSGIARLNVDGTLDTTFNPSGGGTGGGISGAVSSIAIQSITATDDKILMAGNFSSYKGTARSMIARLNADGSVDASFNPGTGVSGTSANLKSVVPQADGRILIGGHFSSYNGASVYNIIRLNYDGTRDLSFYPRGDYASTDSGKVVNAILLQPDNKILIGGNFTSNVARMLNHLEPCYSLAYSTNPVDGSGGTITRTTAPNCPGSKYISGTTVHFTITPNSGSEFQFIGWSGDATGTSPNISMTSNKTIVADFLDPPHSFNKLGPPDGLHVFSDITLTWESSAGASRYEYCLDPLDTGVCSTDGGTWISTGSATSVTLHGLVVSTNYQWNVRSVNQVDSTHACGSSWTFTVVTPAARVYLPLVIK